MILYTIHNIPALRSWYFNSGGKNFAEKKIQFFQSQLHAKGKILDIGSGGGLISYLLQKKGLDTIPLDIFAGNYHPETKPVLYDGKHMPFEDKAFDQGLLLTVLHHVKDNEQLLIESARVCRQLIIIEDIYTNTFQKILTQSTDTIINLGYSALPYTNRNDAQWKSVFKENNFRLVHSAYRNIMGVFTQALYVIES